MRQTYRERLMQRGEGEREIEPDTYRLKHIQREREIETDIYGQTYRWKHTERD